MQHIFKRKMNSKSKETAMSQKKKKEKKKRCSTILLNFPQLHRQEIGKSGSRAGCGRQVVVSLTQPSPQKGEQQREHDVAPVPLVLRRYGDHPQEKEDERFRDGA